MLYGFPTIIGWGGTEAKSARDTSMAVFFCQMVHYVSKFSATCNNS